MIEDDNIAAHMCRQADDCRAHYARQCGAPPSVLQGTTKPRVVRYPGFDPNHPRLLSSVNIGSCLSPEVTDGSVCWFDLALPPVPGAIHMLFQPDGTVIIKRLIVGPGGKWLLGSNQTPRWLRDEEIAGPIVLAVHYDDWPFLNPAETARVDAASAEYERQCEGLRTKLRGQQRLDTTRR
jgi:hypothetical protein